MHVSITYKNIIMFSKLHRLLYTTPYPCKLKQEINICWRIRKKKCKKRTKPFTNFKIFNNLKDAIHKLFIGVPQSIRFHLYYVLRLHIVVMHDIKTLYHQCLVYTWHKASIHICVCT